MTNKDLNNAKFLFNKDTKVQITGLDAAKRLMNKNTFSQMNNLY